MDEYEVCELDLKDGVVDVCDPCYDRGTWCAKWELPVKKGIWHAHIVEGERVMSLGIRHENTDEDVEEDLLDNDIGVDAGLCGFFAHKPDYTTQDSWIAFLDCTVLKDEGQPRTRVWSADTGVFSESGYGDGGYPLFAHKDCNGEIDMLRLEFISEDDAW